MLDFHAHGNDLDPQGEQENDEINDEDRNQVGSEETEQCCSTVACGVQSNIIQPLISESELREKIRSLNAKQREIFEVVNKWVRDYTKSLSSDAVKVDPIYIFLTGSAGCGKSHLITTISATLTKALSYGEGDVNKTKILMLAPTGVAAVNVDGSTIHSALGIPADRNFSKNISRLSDQKRSMLRSKLSELCILIIDEISMVSNKLLLHIHQRLVEIFGCSEEKLFAGISIIACGDFYQLTTASCLCRLQRCVIKYFSLLAIIPNCRTYRSDEAKGRSKTY